MKKRKYPITLSKWRKMTTISLEGVEDRQRLVDDEIAKGYRYDKGFIAIGYRDGINGNDFVANCWTICFFLMRVPRFVQRVKGKV